MLAFKFLDGTRSRFTGFEWPLPDAGRPGPWVEASGPLGLCVNGVHACTPAQLPAWLGPDLWRVELGGDVIDAEAATIAARGRLLDRVDAWDDAARRAFAGDCATRVRSAVRDREDLRPIATAVEFSAGAGRAAAAGYWAAVLAGHLVSRTRAGAAYERAFAGERAEQARWLTAELHLSDSTD